VLLFDIFHLFIDSAFRLICSLPLSLTIPANYRFSSQFLSVGLKVAKVFIIVPDVGNGVGETLHFRQQYLKQNGKFSDVSTEFLDMKYIVIQNEVKFIL
jgi:hypothetical protein